MASSEKTALRRSKWKRQILDIIRTTPNASRILVKRQRGLSMDSTLGLIEELLEENLIIATGKTDNAGAGRKATILKINDDGCYYIGIRFSAGGVWGVCTDFGHHIVCSLQTGAPLRQDGEAIIDAISACIGGLMEKMGEKKERLRGIGLGGPGIIDPKNGVIVRYAHIPGWENVPIRQIIEQRFSLPTFLEHGVKCTARALMALPERAETRDLLFLQIGRGISMCVVVDGRIHNGMHYLSGEIGHLPVEKDTPLESLIATDALCARARQELARKNPDFEKLDSFLAQGQDVSMDVLLRAAQSGCTGCARMMESAGSATGEILSSGIMIVDPQEIILSGHLCQSDRFIQAVQQKIREKCLPESLAGVHFSFLPADWRLDAMGAAALPYNKQFGLNEEALPPDSSPSENEN